ncbi:MAG: inorganic pyrophosphatase [Anaerolineae bacterium]|jgi:inorganic pyrophosphatase|nr:inorganic pyrophosphatase [Anaerolineae bacterium]
MSNRLQLSVLWEGLQVLIDTSQLVIDRPRGSAHPIYEALIYPVDYGYLAGTLAHDGGGIDIYVGSNPTVELVAVVYTVDLIKRNCETKLLYRCHEEEIDQIADFIQQQQLGYALIRRHSSAHES